MSCCHVTVRTTTRMRRSHHMREKREVTTCGTLPVRTYYVVLDARIQLTRNNDTADGSMAMKKSLETLAGALDLSGLRVFMRVDFNVPFADDGSISNTKRVRAALPSINFLRERDAKIILCSHLGRPKGKVVDSMRMQPVAACLSELIGQEVAMAPDCVGDEVRGMVDGMGPRDVLLLENVRFHAEEEANDDDFSAQLGALADVYVNDAFGTAHRAHASTVGIASHVPHAVAGFLMEKELRFLSLDSCERPLAAVIGGSKVSTKLPVIQGLLGRCDKLLLGGGLAFTFLKAQNHAVGASLVEEDMLETAAQILQEASSSGVQLLLPTDMVAASAFSEDAERREINVGDDVPEGWMGLDAGPSTVSAFSEALADCRTVVWNGPMGVFEMPTFAAGTIAIANVLGERTAAGAITVVGGGDSVAAIEQAGLSDTVSHVSTGGGATLELLSGVNLPGVACLNDAA